MSSVVRTLCRQQPVYYPNESSLGFVDDVSKFSATDFQDPGIRCSCGSTAIFKNKYSFTHQHIKSAQHQRYVKNWSKQKDNLIESTIKLKLETRTQQIMIAQKDKKIRTLTQQKEILENEKTNYKDELDATKIQFEEGFVSLQTKYESCLEDNHAMKEKELLLQAQIEGFTAIKNDTESLAKALLSRFGYDFGDD
jgi:hypothetical protein